MHLHWWDNAEDRGSAVMEIFRLEGDHIVKHWDVMQPILADPTNANTMF
ncbi:hypothetical protein [Pseudomonas sp. R3-52-08]|nr:hypothetical protein [Pseudomonas sp. R3-52-08]AZF21598.1 hypothetical protein C4J91_2848 [Pseudomonas sp. R3-52-08]